MGFKRTSEGRVFFQGSGDTANDEPKHEQKQGFGGTRNGHTDTSPQAFSQTSQVQIVALLKALNERLKITQADREETHKELQIYKAIVEDLKSRSEHSDLQLEKMQADIQQKLKQSQGAPLKSTEADKLMREMMKELSETRKQLVDLEDKTAHSEHAVSSLRTEVVETQTNLTKTQKQSESLAQKHKGFEERQGEKIQALLKQLENSANSYTQITNRLDETEAKSEALEAKIEEATSQQSRLMRKIDKTVEDRARFMRKIERIEETVLQTRDALNAKAMVLLTDQNVVGQSAGEHIPQALPEIGRPAKARTEEKQDPAAYDDATPFWQKPLGVNIMAIVGLAIICTLAGWGISQIQKPSSSSSDFDVSTELEPISETTEEGGEFGENEIYDSSFAAGEDETAYASDPIDDSLSPISEDVSVQTPIAQEIEDITQRLSDAEAADEGVSPTIIALDKKDDIGAIDLTNEEQLVALLEDNPDKLAEELNKIEPASVPETMVEDDPAPVREAPPAQSEPVERKSKLENILPSTLSPDASLPASIKDIEAGAFEGVPEAQHDLAAIYTAGHGGVTQNYERAAYWFRKAAENGIANAAYNLGVLNHQGLGLGQDIEEALYWYDKASTLGHPEAQYNLGIAYIEGIGVKYDPHQATVYLEKAANNGIMEAAYNLGLIYENGLLGKAEPGEALIWYKAAADKGSPEGQQALEQLARSLDINVSDVNKVAESMQKAKSQPKPATQKPQTLTKSTAAAPEPAAEAQPTERFARHVPTEAEIGQEEERVLISRVQEKLMDFGLYPGPADGKNGPLTADAVRSYQLLHGLNPSGQVSTGLLSHMSENVPGG
jgi:uncharacterized coiled-coil protein SlyX